MRSGRASATAKVIAASTILLASDQRTASLVAPGADALCRQFLASTPADGMLARSAGHPLTRPLWRWLERRTLPGIIAHYWLRKRWIEARCRAALADGFVRVIVLGAGFDTLGCRLVQEFPDVECIEIDHPATQAVKRKGLELATFAAAARIRLLAVDLTRESIPQSLQHDARPTFVIAEGLLMYLGAEHVERLLASLRQLSTGPVRLVFSYMVRWPDGTSGFRPSSWWIDRWLAWRGEPFSWSLEPERMRGFLARHGFALTEMASTEEFGARDPTLDAALRGENLVCCDAVRDT
jgi:methyltransferase (TIGR00027 family)